MPSAPVQHDAHLGTGNGLVQFVCCRQSEQPFDMLWAAPGGGGAANVFHTPRQAYDLVAGHLTRDLNDAALGPVLEAAEGEILQVEAPEPWIRHYADVRPAVEHLAEQLDRVTLTVD